MKEVGHEVSGLAKVDPAGNGSTRVRVQMNMKDAERIVERVFESSSKTTCAD
jgi:hypothetical protein